MTFPSKQPRWDMFEAAILLEAVINVDSNYEKKSDAIKRVSATLRSLAKNRGLCVDDTFRNINGITFQFQSMEYSALGKQSSTHKTGSKLFDEVVALYRDNTTEYNRILTTAHANAEADITQPPNVGALKKWLVSQGNTVDKANWIIDSFNQVSQYALEKKIIKDDLFSISNIKVWNATVNSIQSFKFFRVLKRELYKFLHSYSKTYLSFLKHHETISAPVSVSECVHSSDTYVVTDSDKELYRQFGEKLGKIYDTLSSNDHHVYLTIEEISTSSLVDTDTVATVLKEASWAEKLGCGYILGHNNLKHTAISFEITEAYSEPTQIESVLIENFRRGFRPTSIMDRNRFIALFEGKYNTSISADEINDEVRKKCFKFDERFFLPKALVRKETAQEMESFLTDYFKQKDILFYNVLYNSFADKCESFVYSAEMMVALLQKMLSGTPIYYSDRYCSLKANAAPDITTEIIDFLVKMDGPCSYDTIYEHLPHLNQKDIYNVLHYNNPEILGNSKVEYFHVKTAHISESELSEIKNTTESLLTHSKFITCNEVMNRLLQSNQAFVERLNAKFSQLGIRRIFTYYLRDYYDVDTGIVTKKGMKMSVNDAFTDFAQSHERFTVDDVQTFADYTGTVPYWDTIHRYSVRVNATEFVSDRDIEFDVDAIDSAIGHYCESYITLSAIPDYSRFPSCGFAWNTYLLQQYVFRFSEQFMLLSLGFTKGNVSGVIAKKQSEFDDFDSVVIDALEKTNITSPNEAIQYLCDKGFIAEKRYKKHTDLLKIAIARRNTK